MATPKRRRPKYPQICVSCQRPFGRGSHPVPVFREDYRLLGKAHMTCARRNHLRCWEYAKSVIQAQWILWGRDRIDHTQLLTDLYFAQQLIDVFGFDEQVDSDLVLTFEREVEHGTMDRDRVARIVDEYHRLLRRFLDVIGEPERAGGAL